MSEFDDIGGDDGEPSAPFWMTTFSDMATLLLTFFVMIVAMSEVEVKKFKEALSYFQGRTGFLTHDAAIETPQAPTKQEKPRPTYEQTQRYEELLAYLGERGLDDKVTINLTEEGMHVVIMDSVMFRSGSADLIEPSLTILGLIAGVLDHGVETVVVEGHTDDRPIHTNFFPSNWELSAARATSVVRFFLTQQTALDPSRYVAVGYGEFRPQMSNQSAAGRSRNRRVEILFTWKPWQNQAKHYLQGSGPLMP